MTVRLHGAPWLNYLHGIMEPDGWWTVGISGKEACLASEHQMRGRKAKNPNRPQIIVVLFENG